MKWTTACPDWEERIVAGKSLVPCPPLFPGEAAQALETFKALKIVDVPGMPTFGEISRDWVFDFASAIFGAYDPDEGRQLINEFFLLISKKNTKSTVAAGIMVTALLRNWRNSAEFIILAPTIEVANNCAQPAMDMVSRDEDLLAILKPIPHQRTIEHRTTGAKLKIVAADSETVSGKKATGVLIDELWLFGKMAHADNMLREACGGLASRPEGFVIALSTQSDDPPAGVFKDWLDRFRDIRDGKIVAPRSLGVLYEYPDAMLKAEAYKDPSKFYITNPNLGASVDNQYLLDQLEKAKSKPKLLAGFYAKSLNVQIGMNLRSDRWPGAEYWKKRELPGLTKEELLRRSEVVVVGLDGGGLDDLFGLTLLGRCAQTKDWLSWSHAWCHETVLKNRQSIATVLRDFESAGELTITTGENLTDIEGIIEIVKEVNEAGLLACVAVDPAGLGEMVDELDLIGVNEDSKNLIGVGQGYKMMTALKATERRLAKGTLWHGRCALMDWAVGNLKIEPTATAIRATKQNAGDAKIDPAMALFDAVTVMMTNPAGGISVFDQMSDEDEERTGELSALTADEEEAILHDPHHPRWQEVRERYESNLASQDRDDL
jgi:phage terminase large subunit-like protein